MPSALLAARVVDDIETKLVGRVHDSLPQNVSVVHSQNIEMLHKTRREVYDVISLQSHELFEFVAVKLSGKVEDKPLMSLFIKRLNDVLIERCILKKLNF